MLNVPKREIKKTCLDSSAGKSDVFEKSLRYDVINKIGKDLEKVEQLVRDAVIVFFYLVFSMEKLGNMLWQKLLSPALITRNLGKVFMNIDVIFGMIDKIVCWGAFQK